MLPKTRSTAVDSPAPGVIPYTVTGPATNGAPVARAPDSAPARPTAQSATGGETRVGRFRRKAHRTRLHGYAIVAVALVAFLIALAASNTAHVKVNWVFGSSHVSLVWLVLFAAILGWLLGLATSATFHWRTRAPRRRGGADS
ncbi:MAG TPA: LapA family protein [Solirubrobacteraceae bacterium]|nr:LapA family protein [Solirubrobacteraceae bacterium]